MSNAARRRWSDSFDGDELGVFRQTDRECIDCGDSGADAIRVLAGWRRGDAVTRRLACGCGTTWWQVRVGRG